MPDVASRDVNDSLREYGVWSYVAGTSGTVVVPDHKRVVGIATASTVGGSVVINGGDAIPVPAAGFLNIEPKGNLISPTIIFTATTSYMVEMVVGP